MVTLTFNPIAAAPSLSGGNSITVCPGQTVNLWQYANTTDGSTLSFYSDAAGQNSVSAYIPITANVTYYIGAKFSSYCPPGLLVALNIFIYTYPGNPTVTFIQSSNTCGPKTVRYTETPPSGVSWYWQTSSTGTLLDNSNSTSDVITASTTLYLRARQNGCNMWSNAQSTGTITIVDPPPYPTAGRIVTCQSVPTAVTASTTGANNEVWWYDAASGGIHLATGNTYTSTFNASTTLYLSTHNTVTGCESGRANVIVSVRPTPGPPTITVSTDPRCPARLNLNDFISIPSETTVQFFSDAAAQAPISPSISLTTDVTYYARAQSVYGCSSTLAPITFIVDGNSCINWSENIVYAQDEVTPISDSRSYSNGFGKLVQSQSKDFINNKIWASQPLFDGLNNPAATTLPAPILKLDFSYRSDFVQNASGEPYSSTDFDLPSGTGSIYNPNPVGNGPGTLGWYYSSSNNLEPATPVTQFPYNRSYTPVGPNPTLTVSAGVGENNKMGSTHEIKSERSVFTAADLTQYYAYRSSLFPGSVTPSENIGYKIVATDPNGKQSSSFTDADGKSLASVSDGKWNYTFYNTIGQVVATVTPNGTNAGSGFVSTYAYDHLGRMIESTSVDEGTSRFVYSTDGKIRFSENQLQRDASPKRFSYTNYDYLGRLVESGEYTCGVYVFEPHSTLSSSTNSVLAITDNDFQVDYESIQSSNYTGVSFKLDNLNCKDYSCIKYDQPVDGNQNYLTGQVSKTENENSFTLYSYDEFGQLKWSRQRIKNTTLNKAIDYTYDYFGNVTQVAYQTGQPDAFYHHYQYDVNQRLINAKTSLDGVSDLKQVAHYYYYLHGPLKRVELGVGVQGIDYIYNIDESLKFINHPDPAKDIRQDGIVDANFQKDAFGMALDYNPGDYSAAGYGNAGSFSLPGTYPDQFGGAVKSIRWHSPTDSHVQHGYAFNYDNRYQLTAAEFGNVTGSGTYSINVPAAKPYKEAVTAYDPNGNILALARKGKTGNAIADYGYNYTSGTNKLASVTNAGTNLLSYQYNSIGQMVRQTEGANTMNVSYTPYGLTKEIRDGNDKLKASYTYDDRGNRLNKTTYSASGAIEHSTLYVSDVAGNTIATYEQDVAGGGSLDLTEVPVYGTGRVGVYKPAADMIFYEVTDHLGNVRAVIGNPGPVTYTATLEDNGVAAYTNPRVQEMAYFKNLSSTTSTARYMNHSAATAEVPTPNATSYTYWKNGYAGITPDIKSVGPAIGLTVQPGDKLSMEAYVKFETRASYSRSSVLSAMSSLLGNDFVNSAAGLEGVSYTTQVFNNGLAATLGAGGNGTDNTAVPSAYLYYMLYDRSFNFVTSGWKRVSNAAGFSPGSEIISTHEQLTLPQITITDPGYLYIFVSNESEDTKVWFDDLKVTHTRSNIVAGSDFYPFGLPMENREITREEYRYGYQGQYAEKDKETGWNAFELRMYDGRIGRWLSPDPMGQYSSPYVSVGNNPISRTDPTGGLCCGAIPTGGLGYLLPELTVAASRLTLSLEKLAIIAPGTLNFISGGNFKQYHNPVYDLEVFEDVGNNGTTYHTFEDGRWLQQNNPAVELAAYSTTMQNFSTSTTRGVMDGASFIAGGELAGVGIKIALKVGGRALGGIFARVATKGGQTIVGEGMKRVGTVAAQNPGSVILNTMPKFTGSANQVTSQMMTYNRQWILQQMRSGRPILDIGLDATRANPSIFYQMEQNMMKNYLKLHPNAFQIIK